MGWDKDNLKSKMRLVVSERVREYDETYEESDEWTFFSTLSDREPQPKGELNYVNPYTLLVAVVLSAQA